nr:UDP-N-acetylglucosamine 2-epimerase (non-hydrolyzing) [Desulfuribacillus stibiiarsenatis]
MKVLTVFGTRPEAIKMAPLVKALEMEPSIISKVCVTAQHREMLDQVLRLFQITPDYDLNIMKDRQTLTGITSRVLTGLEEVLTQESFDIVLVHGDTTTTMAASLAAFYQQVAVGHVEAGLRTYDKYSPFPEEVNRQMTGIVADLHFAPTETAKKHLLQEHKPERSIYVTGNTVIDALHTTVQDDYSHPVLEQIPSSSRMILVTAHRRENHGQPLVNICQAILRIIEEFEDVHVVYPVHMNPNVKDTVNQYLSGNERVHLLEPLEVLDFHNFMKRAYLILTDSGGLQEEAPSLGVPVLVLRDTTERPEGIAAGTLKLAGTDEQQIFSLTSQLLTNVEVYQSMSKASNPYGDGKASSRIVEAIAKYFQNI